jgi:hypothetical protein
MPSRYPDVELVVYEDGAQILAQDDRQRRYYGFGVSSDYQSGDGIANTVIRVVKRPQVSITVAYFVLVEEETATMSRS